MNIQHRKVLPFLMGAGTASLLAACGSGGSGSGPGVGTTGQVVTITDLAVFGTLTRAGAVTVRGVADQDAIVDTGFRVAFSLDGGGAATSLPGDPGLAAGNQPYNLPISITDLTNVTTVGQLSIVLNP